MNLLKSLVDLFLPPVCHICNSRLLDDEEFICSACRDALPSTGYENYWTNKTAPNRDLNPMEQRFAGQIPMIHAVAPFFYTRDSSLASLVHDFKYRGFSRLATTLGHIGSKRLENSGFFNDVDIILPIPLHWIKLWKRGYNQTEKIALGISRATGIPVGTNLKARRHHRTQTSLTAEQRIANTAGIFRIDRPEEIEGKTVMLVDDICTTGATLLSASEALTSACPGVRLKLFTLGVV